MLTLLCNEFHAFEMCVCSLTIGFCGIFTTILRSPSFLDIHFFLSCTAGYTYFLYKYHYLIPVFGFVAVYLFGKADMVATLETLCLLWLTTF